MNQQIYAILLLCGAQLAAASPLSDRLNLILIKSDPAYYSAEGQGKERDEAVQAADKELLMLVVGGVIHVQTDMSKTETVLGDSSKIASDYRLTSHSFITTYLRGLQHLSFLEKDTWTALSYIHKDSLVASFALRKAKIREFFNLAMNAADEGRVGESLRNLYWGFLLSHAYFGTLPLTLPSGVVSTDPKQAFRCLINSTLEDLQVTAKPCYQDPQGFIAPLNFYFKGKTVSELWLTYYGGGEGMDHFPVEDGSANIPFYDKPAGSSRSTTFQIEYAYESELGSDEEIKSLYAVFKDSKFDNEINVELIFPWNAPQQPRPDSTKSQEIVIQQSHSPLFAEALDLLKGASSYARFADLINQYSKLKALTAGTMQHFNGGAGCYVVITDRQQIFDLLYFDGCAYKSIKTEKTYSELTCEYPDLGQFWFKEITE